MSQVTKLVEEIKQVLANAPEINEKQGKYLIDFAERLRPFEEWKPEDVRNADRVGLILCLLTTGIVMAVKEENYQHVETYFEKLDRVYTEFGIIGKPV